MIVKQGDKYLVKTENGKQVLGTHSSHASALEQLRAIEASKHARGGK